MDKYPLLEKMIKDAKSDIPLGVVYPLSAPALETVFDLIKRQLCTPVFGIGCQGKALLRWS